MPVIICHCLYEELKGEEALPSVVSCAPSVVATEMENQVWSPFPKNALLQTRSMPEEYRGIKLVTEQMGPAAVSMWIDQNERHLPIMILEMFQTHAELVEMYPDNPSQRPFEDYLLNFVHSYQDLVKGIFENRLSRGMNLGEMVKCSLRAAKVYIRATTDVPCTRDFLKLRCDHEDWNHMSKTLVNILEKWMSIPRLGPMMM